MVNSVVEHWDLHKARLEECAQRLSIPNFRFMAIEREVQAISDTQTGILKIVITRGAGGRGYGLPDTPSIQVLDHGIMPAVSHYKSWQEQGVNLAVSDVLNLRINLYLQA